MWKSTKSLRIKYFFKSKLDSRTLILLIYKWSRKTEIKDVCHEYQLDKKTVIDWFLFMRDRFLNFK